MVIVSEVGGAALKSGISATGVQVKQGCGNREAAVGRSRNRENRRRPSRRQNKRVAADNPLVFHPRSPRLSLQAPPAPPARVINPFLMRFLFEKQLQKSDVSSAGRIVIPKKLAESNLPPLNDKGGFWMHLDDMDYPQVWTFKFRFWPNNRGRMYVLENAKEFISKYCLELGDYLMVFKDDFTGSYLIRARKKSDYAPTQAVNNTANASNPPLEEYPHHGDDDNNQHDFGGGAAPDYTHLIRTPCCESLNLSEFPE